LLAPSFNGISIGFDTVRATCARLIVRMLGINVVGVNYHTISVEALPHVRHLYSHKSPSAFEDDVCILKRAFDLISFDELDELVFSERPRKRPAAFITFDDGMAECFSVARPILLRHSVPCIFFIPTNFIDNHAAFYRHKVSLCIDALLHSTPEQRSEILGIVSDSTFHLKSVAHFVRWIKSLKYADRTTLDYVCVRTGVDVERFLRETHPYMTTPQLEQLVADGFVLGGHGRVHVHLNELQSPEEVEREIVDSCRAICEISKRARVPFAFPFSAAGIDSRLIQQIQLRHPFISLIFGSGTIGSTKPYINRIGADRPSRISPRSGTAVTFIARACMRHVLSR
jgi:peptidoglycan/xylan/chitin deacetylase (PgdA/CDA1 family)